MSARIHPRARRQASRVTAVVTLAALSGVAVATVAPSASAAGLYFSDRGSHPLARGGAFVAGADDINAIWYNPAGLADAGTSVLLDGAWLAFRADFTRKTQVNSAGALETVTSPTVRGTSAFLPPPTVGGSLAFGDRKQYTAAFGFFAPMSPLNTFPLSVNGQPASSRYSLVSLDGSILFTTGLYFAYKPVEQVRIGIGLEALVGTFDSSVVFSASPNDRLVGAPEDPQYDALSQVKVGPIVSPSGNGGITVVPEPHLRIAVSGQLPFIINAPAKVSVKLPDAPFFNGAYQEGENAHVKFELPAIFRAGIEFRTDPAHPHRGGRIEFAYVREFWTTHHSIDIVPDNLSIRHINGFPDPFQVSAISLPRNFDNSNSFRLGGEYAAKVLGNWTDFRLGVNYEKSAIPAAYESPLTIDMDKLMVGFGTALHAGPHLTLDWVYAHFFTSTVDVDPATAGVPKVNPVKGNPTDSNAINGGTYVVHADLIGGGITYTW